jgi:hypothetical protein
LKWWAASANREYIVNLSKAQEAVSLKVGIRIEDGHVEPIRIEMFLRDQRSLIEAAVILAYLIFLDLLQKPQKFGFCANCDAVFVVGRRRVYHTPRCGSCSTSQQVKDAHRLRENLVRVETALRALRNRPGSIATVQDELLPLFGTSRGCTQWVARCIAVSKTDEESAERASLLNDLLAKSATASDIERMKVSLAALLILLAETVTGSGK